jgi:hypothetical protein
VEVLCPISLNVINIIHEDINIDITAIGSYDSCINGKDPPIIADKIKGPLKYLNIFNLGVFFHLRIEATGINNPRSKVRGTKNKLKYGGPTEILPHPKTSAINGYKVPKRITAVMIIRIRLLANINNSLDRPESLDEDFLVGPLKANNKREPPITTIRKIRIKIPLAGSVAKACTDVRTPDRTKKVPSKLREKAIIASSNVQLVNAPRLSVTERLWIKAVQTNHGMREAFSTGSQNHQPPQPSS